MKDPHVISSGAAHEVSVAPGSSVARSHVAVPRDTVIRQNAVAEPEYLDLGESPERDTLAIGHVELQRFHGHSARQQRVPGFVHLA